MHHEALHLRHDVMQFWSFEHINLVQGFGANNEVVAVAFNLIIIGGVQLLKGLGFQIDQIEGNQLTG